MAPRVTFDHADVAVDWAHTAATLDGTVTLTSGTHHSGLTWTVPVDHADVTLMQCLRNKSFTGFILIQEIPENSANF